MKYKKVFFLIAILCLFLPFVNAAAYDDKVQFHEEGKNGKYGYYEINDTTFWIFNNKPVKTIELLENEYSLLTAYNLKEIEMFRKGKLFDKTNYLDKTQKHDKSNLIESEIHYYRERINKTNIINSGYCNNYEIVTNGTNSTEICSEWINTSTTEEYEDWGAWKLYDFKTVEVGRYQTQTVVKRTSTDTGAIEWVDENDGHDLVAWATWWDANWLHKREISSLNGTMSALYNITYYSGQTDFDDLRFLDFATESVELNYTIISKVDGVSAMVRINNVNETSVMMYYDNSGASTASSFDNLYWSPIGGYTFDNANANDDSSTGNNGTISVASWNNSGYIGGGYTFDGASGTYISATSAVASDTTVSASTWFRTDCTSGTAPMPILTINSDGTGNTGFIPAIKDCDNGKLSILIQGVAWGTDSSASYNDGNWHFITITRNGNTYNLYADGGITPVSTLTNAGGSFSNVNLIGARKTAEVGFIGDIDEVYFYDEIISTDTMQYLYEQTQPSFVVGAEQENAGVSTTLIFPENSTTIKNNTINFTFTSTPNQVNLTNATLYIWYNNGTLFSTNFTTLSGNESINSTILTSLEDDNYLWNAETCGTSVACSFATSNNSFAVHATPIVITISEPTGEIDYLFEAKNMTLKFNLSEAGENLSTHLKNCSYTYNNITTYLSINTCVNIRETYFDYVIGQNELIFNTTDIFDLPSNQSTSWNYSLLEYNRSFNSPVVEGSQETFEIFVNTPYSINNSMFVYNETNQSSNILNTGADNYTLSIDFNVPEVINDTNFTFYFNVSLIGVGEIKTLDSNQSVLALNIANCTTYNNSVMNLSLFNELTLVSINGTIEFNLELLNAIDESTVSKITTTFSDISDVEVCSNLNVTSPDYIYNLELRYYSSQDNGTTYDFVPEFYHIQKASTENLPQSINLYDLNINESTEFTIFYRDNDYVARENTLLQMQRKYVDEGIFRVVEIPITSSEGSAVGHFDLNNYKYQIIATQYGEVINIFPNPSIRCESELSGICTINLKGEKDTPQAEQTSDFTDFFYVADQNDTSKEISILYTIPTGESKVTNIEMTQVSPFTEPTVLCNRTLLSSGGQVECSADDTIGDSQVYVRIISDGAVKANLAIHFQEDLTSSFALQNYFIAAILLIFLITMFVTSPQIMIIVSIFGVMYLGFMFLLKASSVGLVLGAVSWLIVAAMIIITKLNKSEEE